MVILTLLILGLKYFGKLLWYLCLPPLANVIKLFITVIYRHSMVFTAILMFYNTERQYDHGIAVNYCSEKFYNIGPCSHLPFNEKCFNKIFENRYQTRLSRLLYSFVPSCLILLITKSNLAHA